MYLHGNASFRGEGGSHAREFLSNGFNLFTFDFIGCGRSDGDFISLGANEQHDIQPLIDYLKNTKLVTKILMYGWSMGAATTLLYITKKPDPLIVGVVLDSPFSRFYELFKDIAGSFGFPEAMAGGIYTFAGTTIKQQYGFDVETDRKSVV